MKTLTLESLRSAQADKILSAIEQALSAGRSVTFEPRGGSVTVTVAQVGSRRGVAMSRSNARDAAAHCLQVVLNDLAEAAHERAELRERLDSDSEPRLSAERDLRAHDSFAARVP